MSKLLLREVLFEAQVSDGKAESNSDMFVSVSHAVQFLQKSYDCPPTMSDIEAGPPSGTIVPLAQTYYTRSAHKSPVSAILVSQFLLHAIPRADCGVAPEEPTGLRIR